MAQWFWVSVCITGLGKWGHILTGEEKHKHGMEKGEEAALNWNYQYEHLVLNM